MRVRVVNERSDRWDHVGIAEESAWDSSSMLVPVVIGGAVVRVLSMES